MNGPLIAKITASVVAGVPFMFVFGSVVSETIATLPPIYFSKAEKELLKVGIPYEEVSFSNADGLTLRGWFFPAGQPDAPAIFYAPSTAHDQRSGLSLVSALHKAGYSVLLFSYRGYAKSGGNIFGFTYGAFESKDIDAAVTYLVENRGIHKIGAIGHSAGAVSLILSAARNPDINVIVAASPFNSFETVWTTNTPSFMPKFLLKFIMRLTELRKGFRGADVNTLKVIGKIAPRPLLIIHGKADKRITEQQVQKLYQAAGSPKNLWLIENASHAQVRTPVLDEMLPDLISFFNKTF